MRLSWLSPNLLTSVGNVNMTVVEMADQEATGIYVFVSQGMSFYTAWKVLSTINDITIKPVRADRNCRAPLECFTMIGSKQSPPLQRPRCLCPLEDNLGGFKIFDVLMIRVVWLDDKSQMKEVDGTADQLLLPLSEATEVSVAASLADGILLPGKVESLFLSQKSNSNVIKR
ncbi:hypothetical protein llap_975 [Limosa lapponica baueri]|uniref:Uncharacterized protein n=1 Tax=Limosa lapponica baueri TaxID=1758121 RepID=A0A2I0URI5_LIMLA|nr:hypothetical protein llap_975 [Limosa lapponica baueri]